MQGQKGAIGSLPESLAMEHGSASSDSGLVEQQICWNNYNQESQNLSMWSMGESSSTSVPNSASQNRIDPKTADNGWSSLMKVCPESHHHEPPASMLSLGDVNMNITHNHANNGHHHGPLFVQNSHLESVSHNVPLNPPNFIPLKTSNHAGSSSSNPFEIEGQGRHLPCKRKAVELSVGQSSSGVGSSNLFQIPAENPPSANDLPSDRIIPRLGLGVGGVSDDNRTVENSRRNVRIRINPSRQQEPSNLSGPNPSLRLNSVDLRSPPVPPTTENSSSQPVLRIPALRRNMHGSSRWTRGSCPRANRSSNVPNSVEASRTIPTNISDHPIFVQPQTTINWNLNGVAANGNGGAATTNPAPPPSSTVPNLAPHRGSPHYPSRRLSEILRRSLLSSIDSSAGGGPTNSLFSRLPPPIGSTSSSSQEAVIPPVVGIPGHHHHRHHHHLPHSRSSDRLLDGAFGFPYLPRTVSAGSEGRGRLVSEIRNVLDLIRRGEGLRFEDVMILDQSVFYGMADIHDRHRDMRLDIDNMSYEELLALEERIGNVNTGLTEENISGCLKQKKYETVTGQPDAEPCCICQEEYKNGDDLGGLGCGHDFHSSCIKQWLLQKNMCPVCKSAAASATTK